MKTLTVFLLIFPLILSTVCKCGCPQQPESDGSKQFVVSEIEYDTSPQIPDNDLQSQVSNNNRFAFDLYSKLRDNPGNMFFSPFSISTALAMTYEGARGNTETQMAQTLHFNKERQLTHKSFNAINLALAEQASATSFRSEKGGFKLTSANSVWAQQGETWGKEFLDQLKMNYNTGIGTADFQKDSESARLAINKWVEEKTESKIKDLLKPGVLDSQTMMVLVNAIYFYGQWRQQFDEKDTKDGDFTLLDNKKVTVPLMYQLKRHGYLEGENFKVAEIGYNNCDIAMLVILPEIGKFKEIESRLDGNAIMEIAGSLKTRDMKLTLPKFKMDAQFELAKTLTILGMPDAFGDKADFSGMDGKTDLYISHVIHKAFVAVDEKGTEAAAATAVIMTGKGIGGTTVEEPVEFKADHPFIFAIYDKQTGSILFLGRVMDPS